MSSRLQTRAAGRSDAALLRRDRGFHSGFTGRSNQVVGVRATRISRNLSRIPAGRYGSVLSRWQGRDDADTAADAAHASALAGRVGRREVMVDAIGNRAVRGMRGHPSHSGHRSPSHHVMVVVIVFRRSAGVRSNRQLAIMVAVHTHRPDRGLEAHAPGEQQKQEWAGGTRHARIRRRGWPKFNRHDGRLRASTSKGPK